MSPLRFLEPMKSMMKQMNYFIVIVLLGFFCNASMAASIRIFINSEKDLLVFSGKISPADIADETNSMLFAALKDHSIEFVPSSYKRALRIMSEQPSPSCLINKIKTPDREASFLFSLPVNLYLSRRLYIQRHLAPLNPALLDQQGNIKSLPLLFDIYKNKLIVVASAFSYGPFLDAQLAKVKSTNKVERDGINHYETVYRMFNSKRVDFLLAYPTEIYRQVQIDEADYKSYSMANSPEYISGHVMCNDTKHSRIFIDKVNDIMAMLYKKDKFIEAHLKYLPEKERSKTRQYISTLN
jgi:uncharacterized protein (TIGR02285 family)